MRGDGKAAPMKLPPLHRYKISKKIHMLLVCVDFPVSIYRIHYHPMPGLSLDRLHAETINFISQLSTRNGLVVRPYHHTYDKQYAQAVEKVADGALFDRDNNGALFKRFLESEIVVHNYLGTSYIETMMLNVPTICFYDPNVYLFREEARDLMYDLESVGVIHRSAESAVEFMNKIEGKIQDWWLGGDVQFAKDCFLYKYADSSPQWKSNMKYHLLEQVKLAK